MAVLMLWEEIKPIVQTFTEGGLALAVIYMVLKFIASRDEILSQALNNNTKAIADLTSYIKESKHFKSRQAN